MSGFNCPWYFRPFLWVLRLIKGAPLLLVILLPLACKPPEIRYIPVPCAPIPTPPRPRLPIEDYRPEWTKDQMLSAYAQSCVLLLGWGNAQAEVVKAHNAETAKK